MLETTQMPLIEKSNPLLDAWQTYRNAPASEHVVFVPERQKKEPDMLATQPMSKNGVLDLLPANRHSSENRPLFDDDGSCHGFVQGAVFVPAHTLPNGRDLPDQYCWLLVSKGTSEPYTACYWTGTRLTRESKLLALWTALELPVERGEIEPAQAQGLAVVFWLKRKNDSYQVVTDSVVLDASRDIQLNLL